MDKYPWYEIASGEEVWQGDIIDLCPIVVPSHTIELGIVSAEVIEYDVVVMSQTCDLMQRKLDPPSTNNHPQQPYQMRPKAAEPH